MITMGATSINLYRSGNATGPLLDRLRMSGGNFDIGTYADAQGVVWVTANTGGVSTWDKPDTGWSKTWMLPAGSVFPNDLILWNDAPGHWLWEPAADMPIQQYQAALARAGALFARVT